jgi:hypothetical protein
VCPVVAFCVSSVESWVSAARKSDGPLVSIKGNLKFVPEEVNARYISLWVPSAVRVALRTL